MNTFTSIIGFLILTGGMCACGWYFGKRERLLMTPESKPATKRSPVFTVLSVLAPFIGLACLLAVRDHVGTMDYMPNANKRLAIMTATPLAGFALVVVAWMRGERYQALRYVGLFLGLVFALVVVFLIAASGPSN